MTRVPHPELARGFVAMTVFAIGCERRVPEIRQPPPERPPSPADTHDPERRYYWYGIAVRQTPGRLYSESDTHAVYWIADRHGKRRYHRVAKTAFDDTEARDWGYRRAIRYYLGVWRKNPTHGTVEWTRRELRRLTGLDFSQLEDWTTWLLENESRLLYSEAKGRLVVGSAPGTLPAESNGEARPDD